MFSLNFKSSQGEDAMNHRMKIGFFLLFSTFLLLPATTSAQVDEESFQQLEFNFVPPGARATAMGGAFIALADDATAAISNPAGLLALLRPEISFELKALDYSVHRLAGGESLRTLKTDEFGKSVTSPSFASFVYPGNQWAIGVFRHEFLNFEDEFGLSTRPIPDTAFQLVPAQGAVDILGEQFGLSLALRLGKLDVGGTIKYMRMDIQNRIVRVFSTGIRNEVFLDDADTGFGFGFGFILHITPKFQIGGTAHFNPRFHFEGETLSIINPATNERIVFRTNMPSIAIPHVIGGGFAIRPTDALVITADVVWVNLSRMFDESTVIYDNGPNITADRFNIDDRVEVHGGLEYVFFAGNIPIALRIGGFVVPEKRIHYRPLSDPLPGLESAINRAFQILYNRLPEDTDVGFSAGLGFVISNTIQIDAAFSLLDTVNQFSISAVVRF